MEKIINEYVNYKSIISLLILVFVIQLNTANCQVENIEFNICYGDNVVIPPDPKPPVVELLLISNDVDQGPIYEPNIGPPPFGFPDHGYPVIRYSCPYYDSITVEPNVKLPILNLTASTEFTITYNITKDRYCNSTYIRKIKVNVSCSAKNNTIVRDYPWLAALTNGDECDFTSIEVYEKDNFNYIKLNTLSDKVLYYQNGSLLCRDNPSYNCLEAYALTNKIKTWSCDQTAIENPAEETANVFNTYSWLTETVDQTNCNNETITVYDEGTYEFVVIDYEEGARLYETTGTFYYYSPIGFGYLHNNDAYEVVEQWVCNDSNQGRYVSPKLQDQGIQMFPNPATDKLFINLQELTFEQPVISVYDVQGKQVKQLDSAATFAGIVQMDVGDLERGIYLLEVFSNNQKFMQKLIIN